GVWAPDEQGDGEKECFGGTGACCCSGEGHCGKHEGGSAGRAHGNLHWGMDGFTSPSELCPIMALVQWFGLTQMSAFFPKGTNDYCRGPTSLLTVALLASGDKWSRCRCMRGGIEFAAKALVRQLPKLHKVWNGAPTPIGHSTRLLQEIISVENTTQRRDQ